jgi:diadenosine tetraphosphate (Ap4A) HIT family hydrolase
VRFANDLSQCPFCNQDDISSRLVCNRWEEGVYLVSDAHPVVFGHLLGVSEYYHLSFGELDVETLSKLRSKIIETSKLLVEIKPRVILFERGNKTVNISGTPSIDHAHFHLIPTENVRSQLPLSKRKATFLDLPNYINECSYYFYWDIFDDVAY